MPRAPHNFERYKQIFILIHFIRTFKFRPDLTAWIRDKRFKPDSKIDGMLLMGGLVYFSRKKKKKNRKSCFRLTLCKFATPQNSFVHVVSTWLCAWTHLKTPFADVFLTEIVAMLKRGREKKSYLEGVCLCERGVMLKNPIFAWNGHPIRNSAGEPH